MHKVFLAGNVGQDATQKQVGDTTVVEFSVASTRTVKGEKRTQWFRCAYWGKPGIAVQPYLVKGTSVAVSGDFEVREYESKGKHGVSCDVRVDSLQLCGGKRDGDTRSAPQAADADDSDHLPF
jgi:single stranded DNA-binding protein